MTKDYGTTTAVDEVSLGVAPGEIVALLGPNGAGKTTLIGCVGGLTVDFQGQIEVAGFDVVSQHRITRRLVGLVPQELNYDGVFSVRESLEYQAGYFGVSPEARYTDALLDQFSLTDKADENSRWLSGGMKRRLMIAKALVHRPVLLFLDEPTAGVDVELRDELWEYVRKLRREGTTIVLTTHYLEEAEALADRIAIMNRGRLLRVQERDEMLDEFGTRWARVELDTQPEDTVRDRLSDKVEWTDRGLRFEWKPGDAFDLNAVLEILAAAEPVIVDMEVGRTSLESIFKELVLSDEEEL